MTPADAQRARAWRLLDRAAGVAHQLETLSALREMVAPGATPRLYTAEGDPAVTLPQRVVDALRVVVDAEEARVLDLVPELEQAAAELRQPRPGVWVPSGDGWTLHRDDPDGAIAAVVGRPDSQAGWEWHAHREHGWEHQSHQARHAAEVSLEAQGAPVSRSRVLDSRDPMGGGEGT